MKSDVYLNSSEYVILLTENDQNRNLWWNFPRHNIYFMQNYYNNICDIFKESIISLSTFSIFIIWVGFNLNIENFNFNIYKNA